MRQSHERLLAAKGITLGKPLLIRGFRAYVASNETTNAILLLRGNFWGASWPSIATQLEQSGIDHWLIQAGKTWIVVADSSNTRSLLQDSSIRARQSVREQVLVPEVGFVTTGVRRKLELRSFIGPVIAAVVVLLLALVPADLPDAANQTQVEAPEISCALDLPEGKLREWIASGIDSSSPKGSGELIIQSKLGLLKLEIEQILGSTQSVTGSIKCDDGRSKTLHYRLDASANGSLVDLGQKLNP